MTATSGPDTITIRQEGPRNAHLQKGTGLRYYTWQGREVPSVTSVRNMAGQPHALVAWKIAKVLDRACGRILRDAAGKETGYEEGSLDELTAMLTRDRRPRERVLEKNRIREARKFLGAAPDEERDHAAARGTAVHRSAELGLAPDALTDYQDPESGVVIPADEIRQKYRQYLHWLDDSGAEVLLQERQVWNLTLGYAGSFDVLVRFPNQQLWIVDLKTGGTYSDHSLQQMAYLMGEFIGQDDVVDEDATTLLHQVSGVALLQLRDDGWTFKALKADSEAWAAFRGLLAFATWSRDHADDFIAAEKSGAA